MLRKQTLDFQNNAIQLAQVLRGVVISEDVLEADLFGQTDEPKHCWIALSLGRGRRKGKYHHYQQEVKRHCGKYRKPQLKYTKTSKSKKKKLQISELHSKKNNKKSGSSVKNNVQVVQNGFFPLTMAMLSREMARNHQRGILKINTETSDANWRGFFIFNGQN